MNRRETIGNVRMLKKKQMKWMLEYQVEKKQEEKNNQNNHDTIHATRHNELTSKVNVSNEKKDIYTDWWNAEISSHTCTICYNVMISPDRPPVLLFPCGHTFCRMCLTLHSQNNRYICPYCRSDIKSEAVNQSLKQLIQAFITKHPRDQNTMDQKNRESVLIRFKILANEKSELERSLNQLQHKQQSFIADLIEKKCLKEKKENEIAQLLEQVEELKQCINATNKAKENINFDIEERQYKLKLTSATVASLENLLFTE